MTWSRRIELVAVAMLVGACATPTPPRTTAPRVAPTTPAPPTPGEAAKEYSCTARVDVLGTPYEGRAEGSGTSTDPFAAKAEFEACAKLHEGSGIDCKETERVLRGHTSSLSLENGVGRVFYVVRLTPVLAEKRATATSELGGREACLAAVETACKGRAAGSVCTAKHVGCEADDTGKNWNCEPLRRRIGAALVPSDPFSEE